MRAGFAEKLRGNGGLAGAVFVFCQAVGEQLELVGGIEQAHFGGIEAQRLEGGAGVAGFVADHGRRLGQLDHGALQLVDVGAADLGDGDQPGNLLGGASDDFAEVVELGGAFDVAVENALERADGKRAGQPGEGDADAAEGGLNALGRALGERGHRLHVFLETRHAGFEVDRQLGDGHVRFPVTVCRGQ